jgi:hypothetical protein
MIKHKLIKQFIPVVLLSLSMIFVGCEKKTEETKQTQPEIKSEQTTPETQEEIKKPVVEEMVSIPDIKGTWTGVFDGKSTTLQITEQTDSSFSGKISINYKQTLNQDVKGNFSPASLKISMADQLHSKFMGKYNGKLSKDYKNFSGTFTKNRDNSNFSFNLNKN